MKLIENAGALWHKLWAIRMAIISTIYSSAAGAWVLMPYAWQPTLSEPLKWALVAVGVALAASPGVARVVDQPKLRDQGTSVTVPDDNAEHV